jgi:hypothetical protein
VRRRPAIGRKTRRRRANENRSAIVIAIGMVYFVGVYFVLFNSYSRMDRIDTFFLKTSVPPDVNEIFFLENQCLRVPYVYDRLISKVIFNLIFLYCDISGLFRKCFFLEFDFLCGLFHYTSEEHALGLELFFMAMVYFVYSDGGYLLGD